MEDELQSVEIGHYNVHEQEIVLVFVLKWLAWDKIRRKVKWISSICYLRLSWSE